ncbi:porin [Flammeovirga sp. SJP92]|uniref:porin n=1 Tax=Flammeovirga sp. SJP92 TaxID=1775430 RepID=UPI000786DA8B|nr:porin [Flammeovirga sp. SJP92]KXX71499.1 hypothetical protein AVL50_06255 [Flammeovirga sp. SJP92]
MKKLFIIVIFLVSFQVFGQEKIKLFNPMIDARVEYSSMHYDQQSDQFQNEQKFQFPYLFIGAYGNISPNISYLFQFMPVDVGIAESNISESVTFASLTYKTNNERWAFTLGRGFMNVGTFEQEYNPCDIFQFSMNGMLLDIFTTGVTIDYFTKSGQNFGFQVINATQDSTGFLHQLEYNAYWYGFIIKDKLNTRNSISWIPSDHGPKKFALNLGLQWNFGKYSLETDCSLVQNMPGFYENASYQSVPIKLKAKWGRLEPFIKYSYNKIEWNTSQENTPDEVFNALTMALVYQPQITDKIKLYLVSTFIESNENKRQQIAAGVRLSI